MNEKMKPKGKDKEQKYPATESLASFRLIAKEE